MVPLFEGDISQSQRSLSPQPPPPPDDTTRNKERGELEREDGGRGGRKRRERGESGDETVCRYVSIAF